MSNNVIDLGAERAKREGAAIQTALVIGGAILLGVAVYWVFVRRPAPIVAPAAP